MMICYMCKGRKKPICPICQGSGEGHDMDESVGLFEALLDASVGKQSRRNRCGLCNGTGHAPMECPQCEGLGVIR